MFDCIRKIERFKMEDLLLEYKGEVYFKEFLISG